MIVFVAIYIDRRISFWFWWNGNPLEREKKQRNIGKINLWTSITQDWATGHVGLQLLEIQLLEE